MNLQTTAALPRRTCAPITLLPAQHEVLNRICDKVTETLRDNTEADLVLRGISGMGKSLILSEVHRRFESDPLVYVKLDEEPNPRCAGTAQVRVWSELLDLLTPPSELSNSNHPRCTNTTYFEIAPLEAHELQKFANKETPAESFQWAMSWCFGSPGLLLNLLAAFRPENPSWYATATIRNFLSLHERVCGYEWPKKLADNCMTLPQGLAARAIITEHHGSPPDLYSLLTAQETFQRAGISYISYYQSDDQHSWLAYNAESNRFHIVRNRNFGRIRGREKSLPEINIGLPAIFRSGPELSREDLKQFFKLKNE